MKLQAPSLAFLPTLIGGGSEVTDTRGWNLSRLYLDLACVPLRYLLSCELLGLPDTCSQPIHRGYLCNLTICYAIVVQDVTLPAHPL